MSKCIYHGGCDDGFGAAWAVREKMGDDCEYYPAVYQTDPPDVTGQDVILVDFSYKRPVLESIIEQCKSLIILDHHKTAAEDLEGIFEHQKVTGVFDMEKSGAMLAWEWFHPGERPPKLLEHIQDRDLWRFELPKTKEISMALRSYEQSFERWDCIIKHDAIDDLAKEGEAINRFFNQKVQEAIRHAGEEIIGGYVVPTINAPHWMSSDLAGELAEGKPFAAVYWINKDGSTTYSLRSRGDFDVSEIALKYGGGGHKNAAGFKLPAGFSL